MIINGHLLKRLPGNINFSVPGVSSDILLKNAGNISISKGSACNAEKKEQSHVLRAITANDCILNGAVRVGIGRFNTEEEIIIAANKLAAEIAEIKFGSATF